MVSTLLLPRQQGRGCHVACNFPHHKKPTTSFHVSILGYDSSINRRSPFLLPHQLSQSLLTPTFDLIPYTKG